MSRLARALPLVAVLALLLAGLALPLRLSYERGQVYAEGSSQRSDGAGTRALFLLLEETGARPERVLRAAPRQPGLLLSVRPSEAEGDDELLDWVRAGNQLLLADALAPEPARRPSPSPSPSASPGPEPSPPVSLRELLLWRRTPGLRQLLGLRLRAGPAPAALPEDSPLRAQLPDWPGDEAAAFWHEWPRDARVLLGTPERPVLLELALGRGRVLALSDAAWLANAGLPRGARLALALALLRAPGRAILFDEYRHGLEEQPGLAYVLARYGLVPTAFSALLLLALVAWRTSPAEAPAAPEGDERAPVHDSLVEARAGIYARTLRASEAARLVEHDLRAGLREALGARNLSWGAARRRLGERRPALTGRLDALRRALEAARRPDARLEALVPLMQRVARFLQEVR